MTTESPSPAPACRNCGCPPTETADQYACKCSLSAATTAPAPPMWRANEPNLWRLGATPAPAPSDRISTALCAPGCERLYEFAAVGPVQRAAVESFADVLLPQVAEHAEPVAWLVEWVVAGQVWTHAHASELPAVDQARRHAGKLTPLYAAPQAPHPATAAGGGEP